MRHFDKYVEDFQCSKPIFKLELTKSGDRIECDELVEKYKPTPIPGDFLSELAVECYRESFSINAKAYHIEKNSIIRDCYSNIRNNLCEFLTHNLEMKNPNLSSIYRWVKRNIDIHNYDVQDGIVLIYLYLRNLGFSTDNPKIQSKDHKNNVILILEAMRDKYEK